MSRRSREITSRSIAEIALYEPQSTVGGGGGGELANTLYVALNGSDLTGNGTDEKPFATYAHAAAVAVAGGATTNNFWTVFFATGSYPENILLVVGVSLCGLDSGGATALTGTVGLGPSFAGPAVQAGIMSNVTCQGLVDLDFAGVASTGGDFQALNVFFEAGFQAEGTGFANNEVGTIFCFGCSGPYVDVQFNANENNNVGSCEVRATNFNAAYSSFGGNLAALILRAAAGKTLAGVAEGCATTALTLDGAGVSYQATAEGVPPVVTLLNGAPSPVLLTFANAIGYAANPGDWVGAPPTTVQQAINRIAANVANAHPIP